MDEVWMGGCQCGRIRYAFDRRPDNPCICHCRMCQKQFGNFFGAFAGSDLIHFRLTRGELAVFRSSDEVERGFCRDCGTPLTFHHLRSRRISVSIGSLDRHSEMAPRIAYGSENCESWIATLGDLPSSPTGTGDDPVKYQRIARSNRQHPDRDTRGWEPRG